MIPPRKPLPRCNRPPYLDHRPLLDLLPGVRLPLWALWTSCDDWPRISGLLSGQGADFIAIRADTERGQERLVIFASNRPPLPVRRIDWQKAVKLVRLWGFARRSCEVESSSRWILPMFAEAMEVAG